MTSSDVLDTCFSIQLIQSGKILLDDINEILKMYLKKQAAKHISLHHLYGEKSWYTC